MAYYDSTRSALAYAERGMPKLRAELACDELITRQKALVTMCDMMHSTERVHEAVRCGCLQQIIQLLNDADETIRFKSISVLKTVLQHTVGRDAFLTKHDGYKDLIQLFTDNSIKIRLRAFEAMQTLTIVPYFARVIASRGLCQKLVEEHLSKVDKNLEGESLDVILQVLEIVHQLLFENCNDDNNNSKNPEEDAERMKNHDLEALNAFAALLNHGNADIKSRACSTLHDLCANSQVAKNVASLNDTIIPTLCRSLQHSSKQVRVAACQALMTICITTEGKLKAAENDAVENIVCLIDEALEVSTPEQLDAADAPTEILNDSLRLNAIRAAEVIAEVPTARSQFCVVVQKFKNLADNTRLSNDVRRAAQETISVIQWLP